MTSQKSSTPLRTGRYVILTHDTPGGLHWDLMLEWGDCLKTWSLSQPADTYGTTLEGSPLADHRAVYLDYEGPVSADRGTVCRWDKGVFSLLEETPERLTLELQGERLTGTYRLVSR